MKSSIVAIAAGVALGSLLACGPAVAGPEEDNYVALRTGVEIDSRCHALKYVEHLFTVQSADEELQKTAQYVMVNDGRMTQDEYAAWVGGLNDRARDQADAVGCESGAESWLLTARARASEEIYRGLLFAFHFDSLPEGDSKRMALSPEQRAAGQAYEYFLTQIYGQSFDQFAQRQREIAQAALPPSALGGSTSWGDVGLDILSNLSSTPEELDGLFSAQGQARWTMDMVELEVVAETNGWRVLPVLIAGQYTRPSIWRADPNTGAETDLTIVDGPEDYSIADYGSFRVALALDSNDQLVAMTFGGPTATLGANATMRLYVPNVARPDYSYGDFDKPEWRDEALAFEGTAIDGPCLGGGCFRFPPEAGPAILAMGDNRDFELFISPVAGAEPAPIGAAYRSGRMNSFMYYKLKN